MRSIEIHRTIDAVSALGIKPTPAVADAVKRSKFQVNKPTANDALRQLNAAGTQQAYDEAVYKTAVAMAVKSIAEDPTFTAALGTARDEALKTAVHPWLLDSLPRVCQAFNDAAPAASAALIAIPEGSAGGSVLDTDPGVIAQLQAARDAVLPLATAYGAYNEILTFLGLRVPTGQTGPGASLIVARIGTDFPAEDEAQWNAANDLYAHAHNHGVELPQLYPWLPIVRHGGRLNLVEPAEAQKRYVEFPDAPPSVLRK